MSGDVVVVWGNCQAEPIATLLAIPLAALGLQVVAVPPVFLVDESGLERVRQLVARSAFLISQPIRDEYRISGCGTAQLASLLPEHGRLLTFPVAFHVGAFPYQVNAHGGDGERVDAPLTDYHDLRTLVAAERGMSLAETLSWWPSPDARAVRDISAASLAQLRAREQALDVAVSPWLDRPGAMMTVSHPANSTLVEVAAGLARLVGADDDIAAPAREFLGAIRAPVEAAVSDALDWPADPVRPGWRVNGRDADVAEVVGAHLAFYRSRPDIAADARVRYGPRLDLLRL